MTLESETLTLKLFVRVAHALKNTHPVATYPEA